MKCTHYGKSISFTLECKRVTNINKYDQQVLVLTPTICDQNKKAFEFIHKKQLSFASQIFNALNLSDKFIKCHGSDKSIKIKKFAHENNNLFVIMENNTKQTFLHDDFKTLKIKHRFNVSDKTIPNKKQKMDLSINDICELSKSEFVKLNITMSMYVFCPTHTPNNTVYVSGKIKSIKLVSSDISKLITIKPDTIKKQADENIIIAPKQSPYISLYSSKKNTIVSNIVDIIKNKSKF